MTEPQQQQAQESLPSTVDMMAAAVLVVFAAAEARLITGSAALVRAAVATPALASSLRGGLDRLALETSREVMGKVRDLANGVAATAARNGDAAAAREVRALERSVTNWAASPVSKILPHDVTASAAIVEDLASRLAAAAQRITRYADDAYKAATTAGALTQINPARDVVNRTFQAATPQEAQAQAWRELTSRGVSGFTDKAGREWNLATYVEMATRTATQRAYNASHRERLTLAGIHYFTISSTGRPCPLCAPWEGMVLADSPGDTTVDGHTFTVAATIEDATAAGLFHPNAILGDHSFQAIGNVENAVRSWYEGPSVELTTARGVRLTVSPNHPVLTSHGWVAAERLREGDQLFRSVESGRSLDGAEVHNEFDQVQPGVSDLFDALSAHGANLRVPAAGDHLHGDGKFCQGDIDVVVTNHGLLHVADAELVEQGCDHGFSGASVQVQARPGDGSLDLGVLRVGSPVRRTLAQLDATSLQATAQGRAADSEATGEVLAGIASGVEVDELVNVHMGWFEGHAYDFQTSFGAYALNSIVVHNCKHTLLAYLPGFTVLKPNQWTPDDEAAYKDTQKLRALERAVRQSRQVQVAALTPADRAAAGRDVRAAQANVRAFTAVSALNRRTRREQLNLGNK